MDGRTGAQAARGEAPAQGGDQDFLLRSCLISPPGRPLPRVPDREWGAPPGVGCPGSSPLSARRPARPRETHLGSGRAGAHLGSGSRALPKSARGAENCGQAPCKARPSRKKSRHPFCTHSAQGSEEAKASEAPSDFGLAGQGVEPGRLPPAPGNSEQGSTAGVLERVKYHLAPFRCTSRWARLPSNRTSGNQGGSVLAGESCLP